MRRKEELHEWKALQHNEKLKHALQKKKMQDMQDEVKRQKKLEEYNKKTEEIKRRLETMRNNYTGEGSHLESANIGGMSGGLDDYDSGMNY